MSPKLKLWGGSATIIGTVLVSLGAWLTTGQAPSMSEIGGILVVVMGAAKMIYDTIKGQP